MSFSLQPRLTRCVAGVSAAKIFNEEAFVWKSGRFCFVINEFGILPRPPFLVAHSLGWSKSLSSGAVISVRLSVVVLLTVKDWLAPRYDRKTESA